MLVWFAAANSIASAAVPVAAANSVQGWISVTLSALGLIVGVALVATLAAFRDRFPKPGKPREKEFTRMLCDQVWKHTDALTNAFAQRPRVPPSDLVTLRVLVRTLREDLAGPGSFVDQMRAQPPGEWPKYGLFGAFAAWGGQVKSLESQLADLQQTINYPLVKESAEPYRDAMLIHHFQTEQAIFARAIDQLRSHAFDLCAAARKLLGSGEKSSHDEEGEHDHPPCPCCRRRDDHVIIRETGELKLPPIPPTPEKPTPPAPPAPPQPAFLCVCAVPQPCRVCAGGCGCGCQCSGAPQGHAHVLLPAAPAPSPPSTK
ncbi:MAG: hypothetical protein CMN73_03380 [Sphingomonas sp.]|nr:hypothetical protein [Sphingomonas sp.]